MKGAGPVTTTPVGPKQDTEGRSGAVQGSSLKALGRNVPPRWRWGACVCLLIVQIPLWEDTQKPGDSSHLQGGGQMA